MEPIITEELSLADRLFGWWYRIAAPPEVPDEAPLRERMIVRSGKLTSVIFLFQIIFFLASLIVGLLDAPFTIPATLVMLVLLSIGVILNRAGKTTVAGIFVITAMIVGLTADFLVTPGGLSPFLLSIFDFYIGSELVAASLIAPWAALPVTLINCLITVGLITFLPKTAEMISVLHIEGYNVYADPIELQIMVAVITFLWVSSAYREMRRANSAEEVNKLTMEMAMQQQAIEDEKRQLEESVEQIVRVHMQVANGNFDARVPLDRHNMLWAVAGSLNNLLARLQRLRYDAAQVQRNEQALQQLLNNVQLARRQGVPLQPYKTGTSLDALIMEISKGLAAPQILRDQSVPNPSYNQPATSQSVRKNAYDNPLLDSQLASGPLASKDSYDDLSIFLEKESLDADKRGRGSDNKYL
jgi:hypothetical protein